MDFVIDGNSYIPGTEENVLFDVFKNMKVSVVVLLIVVVAIYIAVFMVVGNNSENEGKNIILIILEVALWVLLIYIIYINIKSHDDNNIEFSTSVNNLLDKNVAELNIDVSLNSKKSEKPHDMMNNKKTEGDGEVFHISGNQFTYDDARKACSRYGARLATYNEIESAYNNGANWCSYGWSEDQMAYFPTQQKVINELKQIPGHEHSCGRQGVNGGFIANPKVKFGANCFGKKPEATKNDKDYMHSVNHTPAIDKIIEDSKEMLNKYIVAPFNKDKWNE